MNCSPERKQAEGNLTSPGTTRRPNRREGTFGWIQTQSNNPLILPPNQGTLCLVTTITCHPPPKQVTPRNGRESRIVPPKLASPRAAYPN